MANSSNSRGLVLLLLTSVFFITGLLFDYMPMIIDNQIKRTIELATNQEIQAIWSKPPVDINSYYWLFEVTNAEQFMLGEKARIRKVGPFHFVSRAEKRIIELSQNKYRLFYNSTRHFYLNESHHQPAVLDGGQPPPGERSSLARAEVDDESPSGGRGATGKLVSSDLDQPLTLLNPIYASLMGGARESSAGADPETRRMLLTSAGRLADRFNETLFINITGRQALVGRKVVFLEKVKKMAETFGLESTLPDLGRKDNVFGFVASLNGTWQGPFEIYTGYQASMGSLGDLISYKGKRRLTEFSGRCNRLQASAGELRPMPIGTDQVLEMFQPSFCRIVHLRPTGVRKLREGLGIQYVLAQEDFLSAQQNPDNRCYCINSSVTNDNYCSLNGAIEMGPCSYYAPLVLTLNTIPLDPRITESLHDWDDQLLSNQVELVPDADNSTQLLILRRFGLPLRLDLTFTLFMKVIRDPQFRQTSLVPEVSYIPVVMVREMVTLPPSFAKIIVNLESFLALTHHIKVVMYLSAVVLLCCLTGYYYNRSTKDRVGPMTGRSINSGGGSGGGGRSGARLERQQTGANGGTASRVNSADSNRSLPPSRVSHGSLDAASGSDSAVLPAVQPANGRQAASAEAGKTPAAAAAAAAGQPVTNDDEDKVARKANVFSMVDEERLRIRRKSSSKAIKNWDSGDGDGDGDSDKKPAESGETELTTTGNGGVGGGDNDGEQPALPVDKAARKNQASKNWFVKVCSNFVRMLNGIRSSINDASQLEIGAQKENQDRQLEMLAGKIDNWYNATSAVAAETAGELGECSTLDTTTIEDTTGSGSGSTAVAGNAIPPTTTQDDGANDADRQPDGDNQPVSESVGAHVGTHQAIATTVVSDAEPPLTTVNKADEMQSGRKPVELHTERLGLTEAPDKQQEQHAGSGDGGRSRDIRWTARSTQTSELRSDSVQSNQTVINSKDTNDTSDDESLNDGAKEHPEGSLASSLLEDKTLAMEQMELALNDGAADDTTTTSASSKQAVASQAEELELKRSPMVAAASEASDTLSGQQHTASLPASRPISQASGVQLGPTKGADLARSSSSSSFQAAGNQSGKLYDRQIDESSLTADQQQRKQHQQQLEPTTTVTIQYNKPVSLNGVADGDNEPSQLIGPSDSLVQVSLESKHERRDSGVKLDSRNGINDSSFASSLATTTTTTTTPLVTRTTPDSLENGVSTVVIEPSAIGHAIKASLLGTISTQSPAVDDDLHSATTNGAILYLPDGQAPAMLNRQLVTPVLSAGSNRHQQIKGGQPINGFASPRTKLLTGSNGDNNLTNGKIIFQPRQTIS